MSVIRTVSISKEENEFLELNKALKPSQMFQDTIEFYKKYEKSPFTVIEKLHRIINIYVEEATKQLKIIKEQEQEIKKLKEEKQNGEQK